MSSFLQKQMALKNEQKQSLNPRINIGLLDHFHIQHDLGYKSARSHHKHQKRRNKSVASS